MSLSISKNGLNLIKKFEGCRLVAYQDSVGVWTIGWGTTNADRDITGIIIQKGTTITQAQADSFLEKSVNKKYVPRVNKYDNIYHWNQNQLDALTSFAYNIGSIDGLVDKGKRSIKEIAAKIPDYCHAGGVTLSGLVRRRNEELALFTKGTSSQSEQSSKPDVKPDVKTAPKVASPIVKKGSYGQQATLLQEDLNYLGANLVVDGKFGPKSTEALIAWQKKNKLEPDGVYGPKSKAKMKELLK